MSTFVDTRTGSGWWLLLDELNLAPGTVLQAIESALDTGELTLTNTASSSSSVRVVRRHPDFRLFATQNPASGLFKGTRGPLTHDFLSRFQPLEFSALPDAEWVEIVTQKLIALGKKLPEKSERYHPLILHVAGGVEITRDGCVGCRNRPH